MQRFFMACSAGLALFVLVGFAIDDPGIRTISANSAEARATVGEICTTLSNSTNTYCTINQNCTQAGPFSRYCNTSSTCVVCPSANPQQIIPGYGVTSTSNIDCPDGKQYGVCPLVVPCVCPSTFTVVPCGYYAKTAQLEGSCDGT